AATGNLKPLLAHFPSEPTGKVDFEARLRVGKVMRTETDPDVVAEQFFENKLNRSLQVGSRNALINIQTFDLLEGRVMGRVGVIAAVDAAGDNDPDGRLLFFHHANLHRGSVRSQQKPIG